MWASYVPGPTQLIGGNMEAGFFGEVPVNEFITGDELANLIGLTAGISQYSNEPWLKFSYMGNIEFVAKKPFRHTISWDQINSVDAVFGNRIININGTNYKIRLMKAKTEGKQNNTTSSNGMINYNSEWNRLMLPIHKDAPSAWKWQENVHSPTEDWHVSYTNEDLNVYGMSFCASWCQEYGESITWRMIRGHGDISHSSSIIPSMSENVLGWRPVLELVR